MAQGFNDVFLLLDRLNVLDSLLPFLLIFTIVYAVLAKTHIIGEGKKNFNVIVALTLSLMVVIPHITGKYADPSKDPIVIINTAIPNVSVVIVAILALMILIGIFGKNLEIANTPLAGWVGVAAFLVVLWIFGSAAGWFGQGFLPLPAFLQDPDTQALLVMILVMGIVIMIITSDKPGPNITGGIGRVINEIGRSIK